MGLIRDEQVGDSMRFDYTLPLSALKPPFVAEVGAIKELATTAALVIPINPNILITWKVSSQEAKDLLLSSPDVLGYIERVGSYSIELMEEKIKEVALKEINSCN